MNYGTDAGFIEYHEDRGREIPALWTADSNAVILAALLIASEWIDNIYGNSFVGFKTGGYDQEREWPRTSAVSNSYPSKVFATDEIPTRVIQAAYEAAYRQATTPGSLQVDYTPGKYKRVSVDGAISVEYAQFSSATDIQTQIGIIDSLLWPLLVVSATASSLSGSSGRG